MKKLMSTLIRSLILSLCLLQVAHGTDFPKEILKWDAQNAKFNVSEYSDVSCKLPKGLSYSGVCLPRPSADGSIDGDRGCRFADRNQEECENLNTTCQWFHTEQGCVPGKATSFEQAPYCQLMSQGMNKCQRIDLVNGGCQRAGCDVGLIYTPVPNRNNQRN